MQILMELGWSIGESDIDISICYMNESRDLKVQSAVGFLYNTSIRQSSQS